ncbi:MAG: hypothetical protein ISP49_13645 [Reyranella sp.]|jgi:hypothetical protein|nr:hypothetical protein [Reyranella sp.]
MKSSLFVALALGLGACSMPPLPEPSDSDPHSPFAPDVPMTYLPVMAGTVHYAPAELKSWRELNENVAPRTGQTP